METKALLKIPGIKKMINIDLKAGKIFRNQKKNTYQEVDIKIRGFKKFPVEPHLVPKGHLS